MMIMRYESSVNDQRPISLKNACRSRTIILDTVMIPKSPSQWLRRLSQGTILRPTTIPPRKVNTTIISNMEMWRSLSLIHADTVPGTQRTSLSIPCLVKLNSRRYRTGLQRLVRLSLKVFTPSCLHQVNLTATFKVVVSSVPFTSLWTFDPSDSWAGFAVEKAAVLKLLHSVLNVVLLSGDRHEFAIIEFNDGSDNVITEVSTRFAQPPFFHRVHG
jgi:hypothetical protein